MNEYVLRQVKQTIEEHRLLQKGDHVVVGVSGGPDSVCLLHVLHQLRGEYCLTLTAVHVNHMLREEAADQDQRYTEALCAGLGITCRSFAFDVHECAQKWKISTEEAGRRVRYDSFYQALRSASGHKIAVAHNQNDQAETILMRLMRGTGTDGLAGIAYLRDGVIIRPLLDIKRGDIEAYCAGHHLKPCMDLTNEETLYTRNKIRLRLLPFIEEQFPGNIVQTLGRLAKVVQEDKAYLQDAALQALRETDQKPEKHAASGPAQTFSIPKNIFARQHPAIQKRMLLQGFAAIGLTQDISFVHMAQALRLIAADRTSSGMDFPGAYRLQISYETIDLMMPAKAMTAVQAETASNPELSEVQTVNAQSKPEPLEVQAVNAVTMTEPSEMRPGEAALHTKTHKAQTAETAVLPGCSVYSSCFRLTISCMVSTKKPIQTAAIKCFDFDKLKGSLVLRSRRAGDILAPSGMTGSKKLKKFLIDEKIPAQKRDQIPLICAGSEILWIVGLRTSEAFKTDEHTTHYLILQVQW